METVQSVLNTATKAIWGESSAEQQTAHNETGGSEPISGAEGAGTTSEPFDKGNADQTTVKSETSGQEPLSGASGAGTATEPLDKGSDQDVKATPSAVDGSDDTTAAPKTSSGSSSSTSDPEHHVNVDEILAKPAAVKSDFKPAAEKQEESGKSLEDKTVSSASQEGLKESNSAEIQGGETTKTTDLNAAKSDAAEPSTGKETEPLAEDKAVKSSSDDGAPTTASTESTSEKSKEKTSKMDRLKDKLQDKLHIGSNKH